MTMLKSLLQGHHLSAMSIGEKNLSIDYFQILSHEDVEIQLATGRRDDNNSVLEGVVVQVSLKLVLGLDNIHRHSTGKVHDDVQEEQNQIGANVEDGTANLRDESDVDCDSEEELKYHINSRINQCVVVYAWHYFYISIS